MIVNYNDKMDNRPISIYAYYGNREVFKGTRDACRNWITERGFHTSNGTTVYRTWKEKDRYCYDVTAVYYTFEDIFEN